MEVDFILMHLIEEVSSENEKLQRRRLLRTLRDTNDPFALQDTTFIKFFRFPKTLCWDLIQSLRPHDDQSTSLPFEIRFLSVLYFFAHGSYQKCIGNSYIIPLSQATVCRNVSYICKLVLQVKTNVVRFPSTNEEYIKNKIGFFNKFNIKGTIGAIDCTHIPLVTPKEIDERTPAQLYMNRKGYYSVNVEAICDHDLRFLHVNAKFPGSCHDSGIWSTSNIRIHLIQSHISSNSKWLLGDSGYPLEPWLLTPVNTPITEKEKKFNVMHIKARNVIERAFGVLKSRFRCLSNERKLHYSHEKVAYITYACTILHNILQENRIFHEETEADVQHEVSGYETLNSGENSSTNYQREGKRVRASYINSLSVNTQ